MITSSQITPMPHQLLACEALGAEPSQLFVYRTSKRRPHQYPPHIPTHNARGPHQLLVREVPGRRLRVYPRHVQHLVPHPVANAAAKLLWAVQCKCREDGHCKGAAALTVHVITGLAAEIRYEEEQDTWLSSGASAYGPHLHAGHVAPLGNPSPPSRLAPAAEPCPTRTPTTITIVGGAARHMAPLRPFLAHRCACGPRPPGLSPRPPAPAAAP